MAVGCGSDDDSTPVGTGGKSAAGAAGKAGGSTAGDTGEGGEGGAATTLYERLGGYNNIEKVVGKIVAAEVQDPDIASFFGPAELIPSHEPQVAQILECLTIQVSAVAGGPYSYPAKTSDGYQCRSMAAAHAELHIGSGTFDNFITIAAGVLVDEGVAQSDIAIIGDALVGTKDAIVDPDAPKTGPCTVAFCDVPSAGAGGEGGAQ